MTDHDKAPHEELLAQQEQCFYCKQWYAKPVSYHHSENECFLFELLNALDAGRSLPIASAAAIRSLQARLNASREVNEVLRRDADMNCTRATAAEQALAKCFEETQERCAKVCDEHPGNIASNNWSAVETLRDCVARIRALPQEPASAQTQPKP